MSTCCNVVNVWPKTTLLPVWVRDAKGQTPCMLKVTPLLKVTLLEPSLSAGDKTSRSMLFIDFVFMPL